MKPDTSLVHLGRDPKSQQGVVNTPVYHASTIVFESIEAFKNRAAGHRRYRGVRYGASGTPTTFALADAVAELEGGVGGVVTSSGLAAVTMALMSFLKCGDHLLMVDSAYSPTREFCDSVLRRLGIETTYYNQRTEGALIAVRYPPSEGFLETQLENVGEIKNHGLEVSANGTILELDNFRWMGNVNLHFTENEIIDLGEEEELAQHWTQAHRVGYPLGAFYGDRFIVKDGVAIEVEDTPWVLDANGDPVLDENGNKITNKNNPGYIGPPFPTRTFQFGSSMDIFNRFHLRFLLDHSGGNYTESATVRWVARQTIPEGNEIVPSEFWGESALKICHETNDKAILAFCETPWPTGGRGNVVMPADFWKLREVTLSYDVPTQFVENLGFRNGMIYLTGRNLWRSIDTWAMEAEANYSDLDLSNQDYFITPVPRQFTFGIRLGF